MFLEAFRCTRGKREQFPLQISMNEDTSVSFLLAGSSDLLQKQKHIELEPTSSSAEVKLIINDTQLQFTSSLVLGHRIQPSLPFPLPCKSWLGCFLLSRESQKLWVLNLKPQHFLGGQRRDQISPALMRAGRVIASQNPFE